MQSDKIRSFMALAGQELGSNLDLRDAEVRKLGAQLLLSETLEYVIKGLGVTPTVDGVSITDADGLSYVATGEPNPIEMIDGLADVAYTMYWNAEAFGNPLEEAFEMVCDNNLEKFVRLNGWSEGERDLEQSEWAVNQNVTWPAEVVRVSVVDVSGTYYAVGKDKNGKVRKPSSYASVDLSTLLPENARERRASNG